MREPRRKQAAKMRARTSIILACGVLVALVAPSAAQGKAELTNVKGNPVEVESEVTLTSENFTLTASGSMTTCGQVTVHSTVEENGPNHVYLIPLAVTTSNCYLYVPGVGSFPETVTEPSLGGRISLSNGFGTGTTPVTFRLDVPAIGLSNCDLEEYIVYSYEQETDTLSIPGSILYGTSGFGCPTEVEMHADFTLENALGPVVID